ncbi:peptidylprolyl isomerase [Nocardia crassostreae]|uniref:peptidylprolyl isomerase n=1 Tax=Nocardia crassostreae TaxID=53428 RepID=UPI00082C9AF9|nr:peptidylprolyl isomerase [Nocardia crassostreae]
MSIEPQQRHPDSVQTRRPRRIRFGRSTLRRIGIIAAAVTLVLVVSGRADAAPAPLRTDHVPGCTDAAEAQPSRGTWLFEPAMTIDQSAGYTADLATNCGTITIELDAARAPHTVNSFVFLSEQRYFNQTRCHRLTTEGIRVLQCGDPTGTGTGGPGYRFNDENLEGATYPAGTVAMANSGPNSNGSQFFLVYGDSQLPPNYTPFGKVTKGMSVLQNIAAGGTVDGSGDGTPAAGVVLDSVVAARV